MLNTPFSPWPSFTEEESQAVSRVLLSNKVNYWTGQECREFEKEFATWCGASRAIALTNGTVAIDLAMTALGISKGDEVIVTPRTFLASVSSIVSVGATPVFADVDADSQNITAQTISQVLTSKTKAIICVHLAGWPCEMTAINELAKQHNLYVIEDCAQAHGAIYKGQAVGGLADAAAWSFCQDKIMTTGGEGGMLTTNNEALWSKAWSYKDHGKSWDAVYNKKHPSGFRWLHETFGTNWRMLEMQAVVGRIQLKRMSDWHTARTHNATQILSACAKSHALRVPVVPDYIEHAWYRAYAFVRPEALATGWSRDRIMAEINALGVPCYSGSCSEVYLEKAFDNTAWRPLERLSVAKELGETSLMFLVHPTLTTLEVEKTCQAINSVMAQAQK
ncbi:MAG: DegT/DnrJ/EryC1/StrS aminotransferase family protein [Moraxellaceae bacterium]|nr:DegT/DnrJ/EryC1/StrS aminotransferase family protein [Moraxellaceae bacterium]MCP5177540.1 DegT/DnrJ/EryC1/StrS aminotransferase family protein [Moraxellaceae bacterium]